MNAFLLSMADNYFMFQQDNGLLFMDFLIDPHKVPKHSKVFLSHAHSDHVKLSNESEFFATPQTIALVNKRFGNAKFNSLSKNHRHQFDGFDLELLDNGHILGSVQLKFGADGKDYALTSDFRLQDSLLFSGAVPIQADTLVLETTFGSPEYVFPRQDEVARDLISWVEHNTMKGLVLLSGYSLGKAQELTKISNEAGVVPIVHDSIFELNKIYGEFGVDLGEYIKLDHNLKDSSVLIMPPQLVDRHLFATIEYFDKRKVFSALATGWKNRGVFDKIFPLSNHADFNDLISYVEESNPKLVLTDHGFCVEFARKLNKLGYNAKPLKQHKQKLLAEF